MSGIILGSNFSLQTALPLDDRQTVADLTARDAIDALRRFEGMIVYVESEETNFQLVGGIGDEHWTELRGGGGSGDGSFNYVENGKFEDDLTGWEASRQYSVRIAESSDFGIVDTVDDSIQDTDHSFETGDKVRYVNFSGTTIAGLTGGNDYYTVRASANNFRLSLTKADAIADEASPSTSTHVVLTAAGDGAKDFIALEYQGGRATEYSSGTAVGTLAGRALTIVHNDTNPLVGEYDLKIVYTSGIMSWDSINYRGPNETDMDIPIGYRGDKIVGSFRYDARSANYTSSDLRVRAWDVTNEQAIPIQVLAGLDSDGGLLKAKTKAQFFMSPLESCEKIRFSYFAEDNASPAGAFDVFIDEVKLGLDHSVPGVITREEEIDCTGSGQFTGGKIRVVQVGKQVTVDVIESITHTSSTSRSSAGGLLPVWARPAENKRNGYSAVSLTRTISAGSDGSVSFSYSSAVTASGTDASISYSIDSLASASVGANEVALKSLRVTGSDNAGGSVTSSQDITFTETFDPFNVWSGTVFTAPFNMWVNFFGAVFPNAATSFTVTATINGTGVKAVGRVDGGRPCPIAGRVYLNAGDTLSFRPNTTITLATGASVHWIEINSEPDLTLFASLAGYVGDEEIVLTNPNGGASTNTAVRRWTTLAKDTSNGSMLYADSSTLGMSITIQKEGDYAAVYQDRHTSSSTSIQITVNSTNLSGNIVDTTWANGNRGMAQSASNTHALVSIPPQRLYPGDVVRTQFANANVTDQRGLFILRRVK